MFLDISASEILLIGVVAVVAIGPKELPTVMRSLGRLVRRGQYLKFALSQQFEDFMRQHELEELRKGVRVDPLDEMMSVNYEARRKMAVAETTDEKDADEAFIDAIKHEKDGGVTGDV